MKGQRATPGRPLRRARFHRIDHKKASIPYYPYKVPCEAAAGYLAMAMRRFGAFLLAIGLLVFALRTAGCHSQEAASDGGADEDVDCGDEAPTICDDFTEAGEPCPAASALVCFPMCEAGGCYCRVVPGKGPRWVCVTDTTCLPDCAPAQPCDAEPEGGYAADVTSPEAATSSDAGSPDAGSPADATTPPDATLSADGTPPEAGD